MSPRTNRPPKASFWIRDNAVGLVAIFIALTGTAVALPGKGSVDANDLARNSVKSKSIRDAGVKAADIATGAVGSDELADGAVGSAEIGTGQVGPAQIAFGAVGSAQIADGEVGSADIGDGQVQGSEIADGQVGSAEIGDGAVRTQDLATDAIAPNADRLDGLSSEDILAPRAYGLIGTGDFVYPASTAGPLGSDNVERDSGFACFYVDFPVKTILATVNLSGGGGDPVVHTTTDDIASCPGVEDASYAVTDPDTDASVTNATNVFVVLFG